MVVSCVYHCCTSVLLFPSESECIQSIDHPVYSTHSTLRSLPLRLPASPRAPAIPLQRTLPLPSSTAVHSVHEAISTSARHDLQGEHSVG